MERDRAKEEAPDNASQNNALYIHIPFCRTHCTYCDFNVYTHLDALKEPYVEAVVQEIVRESRRIGAVAVHSVYFGGGTPSVLSPAQIGVMLDACTRNFIIGPGAEITVEVNPGTLDEAKLRALRQMGVNRLSIGVETFDDALLKSVARRHSTAESIATYEMARRSGFDNLSLDFIYGWMRQTIEGWSQTLDRALELAPEHFSLYGLQVEDGTALKRQIAKGIHPRPNNDLAADMYLLADERLAAAGYRHYEISNWARWGEGTQRDLRSRHNLTYWRNEPYLGFGVGAHSFWQGERYANVLHPRDYISKITNRESPVGMREAINLELEMSETMIVGLRLDEGIKFAKFVSRFGVDVREKWSAPISQLKELGLIEESDTSICLTTQGRLVSNQLLWRFLPES